MSRDVEPLAPAGSVDRPERSMTVGRVSYSHDRCVVSVEGPLRMPIDGALRHKVRTLLRRGERYIVLDLDGVPRIDAAGVGEIVRAYNMAGAANGMLQIARPTVWVRETLDLVGLFGLLSAG
jgi:anti-anti-sigma factor